MDKGTGYIPGACWWLAYRYTQNELCRGIYPSNQCIKSSNGCRDYERMLTIKSFLIYYIDFFFKN